jgi:YfiR/HmsC-like
MAFTARVLRQLIILLSMLAGASEARADDLPEYRLKAEYLYRFAQFTEWPVEVGDTLNLCVHGADPFGAALDALQGKAVEHRSIAVMRNVKITALDACQIVFVASAAAADVSDVLQEMKGRPALIVADTPGAARLGVALNMTVVGNHVVFEANIEAARAARINLSSRLLRLATEVIQ